LAGAKTGSDIKGIEAHGTAEKYMSDKIGATYSKEVQEATAAQAFNSPDAMHQKAAIMIDSMRKSEGDAAADKLTAQMVEQGMLKKGSTSDNFTATSGDEARKAYAESKAAVMESDERLMVGGKKVNLAHNIMTGDGVATFDSAATSTTGSQHTVKATDYKTLNAKESAATNGVDVNELVQQKQQTEADTSPVDRAATKLASEFIKEKNELAQHKTINSEDNDGSTPSSFLSDHGRDILNLGADAAFGISAAYSADKAGKFIAKEKIPMTESDLKSSGYTTDGDGITTDSKGNEITQKDGKYYKGETLLEKPNPNKKAGPIERMISGSKTGVENLSDKYVFGDTSIKSPEPSTNNQNPNNDGTVNSGSQDELKHGTPPNKNTEGENSPSKDSISKMEKSVKPSISQEIDYHTKSQKREAAFESAQKTRDNLLKVPQSPEAVAKINADFEAKSKAIKSAYPQCR